MDDQSSAVAVQIEELRADIRGLSDKVDRLIVGTNGEDGLIGRQTRQDERLGFLSTVVAWLFLCVVGLAVFTVRNGFLRQL